MVRTGPVRNTRSHADRVCSAATNNQTGEGVAIKKVTNVFSKKILAKRALREIKLLQHFRGQYLAASDTIGVLTYSRTSQRMTPFLAALPLSRARTDTAPTDNMPLRYGHPATGQLQRVLPL
jgi:hypothetical protein